MEPSMNYDDQPTWEQDSNKLMPSILTDDSRACLDQIELFAQLDPQPTLIQLDILDGQFAPELTVEPNILNQDRVVAALQGTKVDLHLMTVDPIDYVHEVYENQSVRAVIGQVERMYSVREFLEEVKANHLLAGLSLDLYTPFEEIDPDLLAELQVVQIMGGQAGRQGQPFQAIVLDKIKEANQARQDLGLKYEIYVDIGMNPETILMAKEAGADGFVIGSYLQQEDPQAAWEELTQIIENEQE
jgi:ribulose-phosphate 3-epimerase